MISKPSLPRLALAAAVAGGAAAVFALLMLVNIFEKKQEAKNPFFRVVELNDGIDDPAVWGKNFPQQYDAYLRTVDQQRTRFGGSEALATIHEPALGWSIFCNARSRARL